MTESNISITRIILGATVFVIILRLFSLEIFGVRGTSMQPTLEPGQTVLVNRLAYGIQIPLANRYILHWQRVQAGDIIVFESPVDRREVVKRCIAVAGTPIYIEDNTLFVNGEAYPLHRTSRDFLSRYSAVPAMTILAIGDNSDQSVDSRMYGFIPIDHIHGRVLTLHGGQRRS